MTASAGASARCARRSRVSPSSRARGNWDRCTGKPPQPIHDRDQLWRLAHLLTQRVCLGVGVLHLGRCDPFGDNQGCAEGDVQGQGVLGALGGLGQVVDQGECVLQRGGRFPIGIPPPGGVRRQPQVHDGARPLGPGFEVMRQLGRHTARLLRVECLQPLPSAPVQPRPATRHHPAIAHLAVQRMHKFVALADAPVRERLHARCTHHLLPAHQPCAQVFKGILIEIRGHSADGGGEHHPSDARPLQRFKT